MGHVSILQKVDGLHDILKSGENIRTCISISHANLKIRKIYLIFKIWVDSSTQSPAYPIINVID